MSKLEVVAGRVALTVAALELLRVLAEIFMTFAL